MARGPTGFWAKVHKGAPHECWVWTGFRKPSGHGLTSMDGLPIHASRKAWILTYGPIRDGLSVLHRCDNALCCNPEHLYLGTRIDNMIDHFAKTPGAERAARNRPHVLTPEQIEECHQMRLKGATLRQCAAHFGVHFSTICRLVTAWRRERLAKIRAARLSGRSPSRV